MDTAPCPPDGTETIGRLDCFLAGDPNVITTLNHELRCRGLDVQHPESLQDGDLAKVLTDIVWGLLDLGVVIEDCDHLSDRELFLELWAYLNEAAVVFPDDPDMTTHWSPIGGCSEGDIETYHRFFADEGERESWLEQFPEYVMHRSELPPYPRPWLPQRRSDSP